MGEIEQFRARSRAAWDAGEFDEFARWIAPVAEHLVRTTGAGAGDEVLDIGCGTGNVAVRAALAGARVTGVDLSPIMLGHAREAADAAGVELTLLEGDAEDLPVPSASADVAVSNFGAMFAPRHAVAAAEMLRVLRPGGRFAMSSWTAGRPLAAFLALAGRYMPPPPEFAEPPLLWGDEAHVRAVFDLPECTDLAIEPRAMPLPLGTVADAVAIYTERFGPIVAARPALEAAGDWTGLVDDLTAFFCGLANGDGAVVLPADHLVISGRRAD